MGEARAALLWISARALAVSPMAMAAAAGISPRIRAELTVPNRITRPHILVVHPARVGGAIAPVKVGICPIVPIGMRMHGAVEIGHANDGRYGVPGQREAIEAQVRAGRKAATPKPSRSVSDAYFLLLQIERDHHVPVSGADRTLAEDYAPLGVKQRLAVEMQCQPRPLPLPRQRKRRPQTGPPLSFSSRAVRDCCRLAHSTPSHTVRSKLSRKTRHGWQPSPLTDARGERGSAGATRACMHSPRVPWRNSRRTCGARTHSAGSRGDRSCRPTRPASGCDDAAPFDAGVPHAHGDGA